MSPLRRRTIEGVDLDHIAVAVEHQADAWPRYGGDLGGVWMGGGPNAGFASAQVRYPDPERTMKVEVLEPHEVDRNDFLRRFLDRSGEGPHHLTFKVPNLRRALSAAEAHGFKPVGVDLSDRDWMEAFLHPRQACGIVVQLAQSDDEWDEVGAAPLPRSRVNRPAVLSRIHHLAADITWAEHLFVGLLGGGCNKTSLYRADAGQMGEESEGPASSGAGSGFEVTWPGGGRLTISQPAAGTPEEGWLGDRPGRVHHLLFRVERPDEVKGAVPVGDGRYEVPPEANHGVRLILVPPHS